MNASLPRRIGSILIRVSPLISFSVAIGLLYLLHPSTFEVVWTGTWKNRLFDLFFIWLICLELILNFDLAKSKNRLTSRVRITLFAVALALPIIYVIATTNLKVNLAIIDLSKQAGIKSGWAELMPLSLEYMVFALFLTLMITIKDGIVELRKNSVSIMFAAVVGLVYLVDNLYPMGQFSPFQVFVAPTAWLASGVMSHMGYRVFALGATGGMPVYRISDGLGRSSQAMAIAWPCSGVESLLIYTVTILLFLKNIQISLRLKAVYFAIGAAVTYVINIARIVTIFIISVNGGDWGLFHDYYGSLYSISWIIAYPMMILGIQAFSEWMTTKRTRKQHIA